MTPTTRTGLRIVTFSHVLKALGSAVVAFVGPAGAVMAQTVETAEWPVRLRQDLARAGQVEWRLRSAASQSCPVAAPDIGVVIDDPRDYAASDRPALKQALGMDQDPVLAGVATGGPAGLAGLQQGDALMAVNGVAARSFGADRAKGETASTATERHLRGALGTGPVNLSVRRGDRTFDAQVTPVLHCGIRVILQTAGKIDAHSDGRNVAVSSGLVTFAQTDAQLALAIAHEFGHAMAGHGKPTGMQDRRRMEDEADLVGIRLTVCAGYDPQQALELFTRLGRRDVLSWLRAPTHRSFGARIERMQNGLEGFTCGQGWLSGQG